MIPGRIAKSIRKAQSLPGTDAALKDPYIISPVFPVMAMDSQDWVQYYSGSLKILKKEVQLISSFKVNICNIKVGTEFGKTT